MNEPHILVVEDDAEMRRFLEDELQAAGYQVLTAANGVEALDRFHRQRFDVVVADLIMPAMKGDELLANLRRRDENLPVVIMTAFGTIDSAVELMRGGAFHYITKPFRLADLLRVVEAALEERRRPPLRQSAAAGQEPESIRSLSEVERDQIVRALRSVRGNKAAAARLLGLDRKTLYRKIDLYGLGASGETPEAPRQDTPDV